MNKKWLPEQCREESVEFLFSVVIAVYNAQPYIRETVDSIINQSIGFQEHVQLILVDDGSTDESLLICKEYEARYPDNVTVVTKENGGRSSASNAGLPFVKGLYVNMIDSDDWIDADVMKKVALFFKEHYEETDLVALPLMYFEGKDGDHVLNYKFQNGSRVIDLKKEFKAVQLHVSSSFIKKEVITQLSFDEEMSIAEDALVCLQAQREKLTIGVIADAAYHYRVRSEESSESLMQGRRKKKRYYNHHVTHFSMAALDYYEEKYHFLPRYIQYAVMYEISGRLRQKEIPDGLLSAIELEDYRSLLSALLKRLDDAIIFAEPKMTRAAKAMAMKLKYGCDVALEFVEDDAKMSCMGISLGRLSTLPVKLVSVEQLGDKMVLQGSMLFLGVLEYLTTNVHDHEGVQASGSTKKHKQIRMVAKMKDVEYPCELLNHAPFHEFEDTPIGHFKEVLDFQVSIALDAYEEDALSFGCYLDDYYVARNKINKK